MPNEQKKCCPKCQSKHELAQTWICTGGCPCHTPTEEKKCRCFKAQSAGEATLVNGCPIHDPLFNTPTVSKMIDIDEVIGIIEGMRVDKHDNVISEPLNHDADDYDFCGWDISSYEAKMYNLALSSLKQKLEAKRKEI